MVNDKLADSIKKEFQLDLLGDHGIYHWKRVEKIGLYLSKATKANVDIVRLFAVLHDSRRVNEYIDPEHGLRAAKFAEKLYEEGRIDISSSQLKQLLFACRYHSDSSKEINNITIQTCWDSDRLDIWRVGKTPSSLYMKTNFAKKQEAIDYSYKVFLEGRN
jgi:uncharacterized protein